MYSTTFKPRKFEASCSGSGWGVWEISSGNKIESCVSRIHALELMYKLNGWSLPLKLK
ncbi:hypothetical protein PJIAN_3719 [Paludibacter jiangxiensis]|uniref:Uncharacterized protein n=1 Tax=Paludibacter jiangxiensis TaxID=681398 RepID=A0A171A8G2_9BACT|nr:hypothetical protein PJIAN_3719 [Paludibacter jiangxiensis]